MSAAVGDWMPPLVGKQKVDLGISLRRALKARIGQPETNTRIAPHDHFAFRYRFNPKSVDPSKPGTLEHRAGQDKYTLLRPNERGDNIQFEGTEREGRMTDCVLIYDEVTKSLSLEKIDSSVDFAHIGFAPTTSASAAPPALSLPTGTKRSPPSLPSLPTREDSKLAAELESALAGDEDADGEADEDFDLVEVQPATSQGAAYDAYDDEEDFASLALPAPGKGKGVARANAATAKAKSKAKAPPRGKKRARDVDDDFEAVPIPPAPVPARAPKRRKSSPAPPPPAAPQRRISQTHTHPSTAQRPEDLLVPPPRPEPHYTSSEDEADMFEEVIPELNGHGHVNGNGNGHVEDVNGHLEDTELVEVIDDMEEVGVDEYDFLAQELEAEMEADPEADVFGDPVEEYEEQDQEQEQEVYDDGYAEYDGEQGHVNGNGHMNGNGNGHGAPISMNDYANANGAAYPVYDDTSSDDSDDDDD